MAIQVGDLVIINDSDKPCTRLMARVTELDSVRGFIRAEYVCKRTNMAVCQGGLHRATLVSEFGVEVTFDGDMVSTEQVRPSVATYPDGKARDWQPSGENPMQELRRPGKR